MLFKRMVKVENISKKIKINELSNDVEGYRAVFKGPVKKSMKESIIFSRVCKLYYKKRILFYIWFGDN